MSTHTISLGLEAYDKLRRAKRSGESFSDVVMRAQWADETITAVELLRGRLEAGPALTADQSPEDKWPTR